MTNKIIDDVIFVGFNKQVIALDRYNGTKLWDWKSPKGNGFPSMLLDGDRLIVSVSGYTFCLEPTTGSVVWENDLKGHGIGIANIVSSRGSTTSGQAAAVQAQRQRAAAASGATGA